MSMFFISNSYLKSSHVSRIPCVLQTVLVAFEKKFQEESVKNEKWMLELRYT